MRKDATDTTFNGAVFDVTIGKKAIELTTGRGMPTVLDHEELLEERSTGACFGTGAASPRDPLLEGPKPSPEWLDSPH